MSRLGLGLGISHRRSADFYRVNSATLKLALVPESIVSSGGVVTQWRDISGNGFHGTPTGSPALDTSQIVPGVAFDAVNDRIDGSLVTVDQPLTVFILNKMLVDFPGGRAYVMNVSDDGSSDRSFILQHIYTNVSVRQPQGDSNVGFVNTELVLALDEGDMYTSYRSMVRNGVWGGSEANSCLPPRTTSTYRLGMALDGAFPWNGSIFMVLVYSGTMIDKDKQELRKRLLARFGLPQPFMWPIAASTDLVSDPCFVVPSVVPTLVGRPLQIWRDSVHKRDGIDYTQAATSALPFDPTPVDRWSVTPTVAGDYALQITESGFTCNTTIRAVDMLAPGAPKKRILCVGDSNTARAGSGWIEMVGNELGSSRCEMVGTQGPNGAYTYKHEGTDSKSWATYNSVGSPFFAGGGALNIPAYLALLANPPDMIIWTLGQNDVYVLSDETNLETTINTAFANAETLIAAFTAQLPSVKHFLATNNPLNMDPASFGGGPSAAALRYSKHRLVHRYVERAIPQFSGREASNIFMIHTWFQVDPVAGYADSIHMNRGFGHATLANAYLAALVKNWT